MSISKGQGPKVDVFGEMPEAFDYGQAYAEASRCLLCHDAPCSKGCPADTDPGRFIRQFRLRNVTGAIRTIKEANILGGSCGHLCPTAELCEAECSATELDRPIRIGEIQRFLIEHAWELGFKPLRRPEEMREEKVACIGAGPASLSAAAELAKAGVNVVLFEAESAAGGALRWGVPSFRFTDDFLDRDLEDLATLGVEFRFNTPVAGPGAAEALLEQGFSAVFAAPGCWNSLRVVPDQEHLVGLSPAMQFLLELRKGGLAAWREKIHGKVVTVIGGGSVAFDCATSAFNLGASDVYIVYRRSFQQMPAEEEERIDALKMGIHMLALNQPTGFQSDEGRLCGLELQRTRLGTADDSGRRAPIAIPDSSWVLDCDICIEAIGQVPMLEAKTTYPNVETDARGIVRADLDDCRTSVPGIFVGGDVTRGPALIIEAIRDGKVAAKSILEFLDEKQGGAGGK